MADRKIILDTETTGLKAIEGDRILEIAAIELFNDKEIGKEFHIYCNPEKLIDPESTKIHGITNEFVEDKPKFKDIADDFLKFIGDSLIIAHNSEFDRGFLNTELDKCNMPIIPFNRFIDTLQIARKLFKGEKVSLDNLCVKFNIDLTSRKDHHGALIDIKLLAKVYYNLISHPSYSVSNISDNNEFLLKKQNNKEVISKAKDFSHRVFNISNEDLNKHQEFIKNKLKDSLWKTN